MIVWMQSALQKMHEHISLGLSTRFLSRTNNVNSGARMK